MKKLSYLMLFLLSVIMYGCAETEQPYVGYIVVERAVVDAAAGSTATVVADTAYFLFYFRASGRWGRLVSGGG